VPASEEDERYLVIDGRRWRRTDPAIPEQLRAELVRELMAARRLKARRRVQDAKVALGERGRPWWDEPDDASDRERLAAAVLTLLRARAATASICPSDAARVAGGDRWRSLVPAARDVARDLARAGDVVVTQRGQPLDLDVDWRGPVRIRLTRPD
jgi:hypothetical protein